MIIFDPKHSFNKIHDDIYSISWLVDSDNELIYGTDRYIRICDIRSGFGYKSTFEDSHAKQVLGIKFDPFDPRRFASYSEDYIKVFDLRNQKSALVTIRDDKYLFNGFEWCLFRANLISSFSKKSV